MKSLVISTSVALALSLVSAGAAGCARARGAGDIARGRTVVFYRSVVISYESAGKYIAGIRAARAACAAGAAIGA